MEPPPVQYATTSDGYNVAYAVQGEGTPLVCLPFRFSHAQQVWSVSSAAPLMRELSARFGLIYYDSRGQGLSQRGLPADTTLDSFLCDLEAVLENQKLQRARLFADCFWSHVAVRMAARHPERVAALVLMHCPLSFADEVNWFLDLASQNWEYYMDMQVGAVQPPVSAQDQAARAARKQRLMSRTTQADLITTQNVFGGSNIADALPQLRCPVLVVHTGDEQWVSQDMAAKVAALIPGGRLWSAGGTSYWSDVANVGAAIERFFAEVASPLELRSVASSAASPNFLQIGATVAQKHDAPAPCLSRRELEVLRLISGGRTNHQIADELVISLNTVKRHVNNILAKTDSANRAEATSYAFSNNLIAS